MSLEPEFVVTTPSSIEPIEKIPHMWVASAAIKATPLDTKLDGQWNAFPVSSVTFEPLSKFPLEP